jgi:hypothetical protein
MSLTALSNGAILPVKLFDLGLSGKTACAILGVPASRLSLCVGGTQDLSPVDAANLYKLIKRLGDIQAAVKFPLSFRSADRWREILDRIDRKNIQVDDIASAMDKIFGEQ